MSSEIELHIKQVYESQSKVGAYSLLLEENKGKRRQIPIIIGEKEAHSIICAINEIPNSRPLTHDLMISCFDFLEAKISKILIYKVISGVYYSYIYLNKGDQYTRIDARTSDAIALAIRLNTPIFIEEEILNQESVEIVLDEDSDEDKSSGNPEYITFGMEISEKDKLENQLKEAIQKENYELASILRDQIADLEK
ncbi:protein of unknown function DUF151 [Bacteroides coprosuis DSM 18011]|uniref:BFN domain-containing protein n=1 Tax=Bacteroides coprosuis DSM 18011 TaxID=679937 RepID=F3ZNR4_9BACE|nr:MULTISPECIES: bifunctional nuclease family protein [Bacteroides]EGJ70253.1 protein of unknown function DUF151 [Bacteroides coprosuis DSM 18011]HJD92901.1 bifunctional nuclease family protein [Bacteroides coprosuis]